MECNCRYRRSRSQSLTHSYSSSSSLLLSFSANSHSHWMQPTGMLPLIAHSSAMNRPYVHSSGSWRTSNKKSFTLYFPWKFNELLWLVLLGTQRWTLFSVLWFTNPVWIYLYITTTKFGQPMNCTTRTVQQLFYPTADMYVCSFVCQCSLIGLMDFSKVSLDSSWSLE